MKYEVNIKIKTLISEKTFDFVIDGIRIQIKNYFQSQMIDPYEYDIVIGEVKEIDEIK